MAPFFHVIIKGKGDAGRLLFGDLDRAALKRRFLKPYGRGKKIVEGNAVIDLDALDAVQIIRTEKPKDTMLDQLMRESLDSVDRFNAEARDSGVVLVSFGYGGKDEDIAHAGTDVTGEFIRSGPGTGGWLYRHLGNNWIITIVGGLIVTVIGGLIVALFAG